MKLFKNSLFYFFILVNIGLVVGQLFRLQFGNGVAITLLDGSVYLLAALWIVVHPKLKFYRSPLFKPLLLFVAICFLSLLINYKNLNQLTFLISLSYLIRFIAFAIFYFVIINVKKSDKKIILNCLLISGALILFIGFVQYRFYESLQNLYYLGWDRHLYRLFSSFLDPNFAGAFAVVFSILTGELALVHFKQQHKYRMFIFLYLLGCSCIALFLTYSRSALIMFIVSWTILLVLHKKTKWIIGVFLLLTLYFFIVSQKFSVEGFNLLRTVSSEARLDSAKDAVIIFKDHPIIGVGFNTYRYTQISYHFRSGEGAQSSHADAGTDNSFLFILATTGLIGFAAYCFLLYKMFSLAFTQLHKKSSIAYVAIASLAGLMVDSLFINSLFFSAFLLLIWILYGLMDYK